MVSQPEECAIFIFHTTRDTTRLKRLTRQSRSILRTRMTRADQLLRQSSCSAALPSVAGIRAISLILLSALLLLCEGYKREQPVIVEEVVVPAGFHGWLEIVQDDPHCPRAEVHGRHIVLRSDRNGTICIAEELPALEWYKREYRFDDGSAVPPLQVHQEEATRTTTYRHWVQRSASFCIGSSEECILQKRPERLPPGPGWQEVGRDRRVPMVLAR